MERIEYQPTMGEINLTSEMISTLQGLSFDEQTKHFGIVTDEDEEKYSYGESDGANHYERAMDVETCSYTRSWIVKDGIIVGVAFSNWASRTEYKFLESWCTTYFCFDDDGTGSTDVSVYCKLVWID